MKQADYFDLGADKQRGEAGYIISQAELKLFAADPDSWIRGAKVEETKSMEWGSLIDAMYLTPDELSELYVLMPKFYPAPLKSDKGAKKPWTMQARYCQNWVKNRKREGIWPITREDFEEAKKAVIRLNESPLASALRDGCETQVFCQWEWTDPVTGITVPLKCLIDIRPDDANYLADLKSTYNIGKKAFKKTANRFRYDLQGAFYGWGHRECYHETDGYALLLSQSKMPYPVTAYRLTEQDLYVGEHGNASKWGNTLGYRDMLSLYCQCLASGHYPEVNGGEFNELDLWS